MIHSTLDLNFSRLDLLTNRLWIFQQEIDGVEDVDSDRMGRNHLLTASRSIPTKSHFFCPYIKDPHSWNPQTVQTTFLVFPKVIPKKTTSTLDMFIFTSQKNHKMSPASRPHHCWVPYPSAPALPRCWDPAAGLATRRTSPAAPRFAAPRRGSWWRRWWRRSGCGLRPGNVLGFRTFSWLKRDGLTKQKSKYIKDQRKKLEKKKQDESRSMLLAFKEMCTRQNVKITVEWPKLIGSSKHPWQTPGYLPWSPLHACRCCQRCGARTSLPAWHQRPSWSHAWNRLTGLRRVHWMYCIGRLWAPLVSLKIRNPRVTSQF